MSSDPWYALFDYYERELRHVRAVGARFAEDFAEARLISQDELTPSDPYAERLMEGFAFLAARIQQKIDARFPDFTHQLVERLQPQYASPVPSMAILQMTPDEDQGDLREGYPIPRHSSLKVPTKDGRHSCDYRTAHEVDLWPLEITASKYLREAQVQDQLTDSLAQQASSAIHLRLHTLSGYGLEELAVEKLPFYVHGADRLAERIYELMVGHLKAVVVMPPGDPERASVIPGSQLRGMGFANEESLLPVDRGGVRGFRLLQEYSALWARFLFVELAGVGSALKQCEGGTEVDLFFLLDQAESQLGGNLESRFKLFCTPAVNLFEVSCDRIELDAREVEPRVVPNKTRPEGFEVYEVTSVKGIRRAGKDQQFRRMYSVGGSEEQKAFYATRRTPFNLHVPSYKELSSTEQTRMNPDYSGTEVFLSIVDAVEPPYSPDLKSLSVVALCTNRGLPLHLAPAFTLDSGAPVAEVVCVAGPTRPLAPLLRDDDSWGLIRCLSLSHLAETDDADRATSAVKELLALHAPEGDQTLGKLAQSVNSVRLRRITRRIPRKARDPGENGKNDGGILGFGRGQEIAITFDRRASDTAGLFVLGAVLEQLLSRLASINSFTETVLRVDEREVMRWPARPGQRHSL